MGRDVAVLVEEEDHEARDPDLGHEKKPGPGAEQPHARVADWAGDVSQLRLSSSRAAANEGCGDDCSRDGGAGEKEEGGARAAGRGARGEDGGSPRTADRDGRLPDPTRKA